MELCEQAVTPEFRSEIARLLPGLGSNLAYWRFAGYLMFGVGLENGELKIPADFIALIENKKMTGKYCAWTFLTAFQEDVVRLDITAWTTGFCRTVTHVHWPAEVETLLYAERRKSNVERVLFSTGEKWRREHTAREREKAQAEALGLMEDMGYHPAAALLDLLNHAASNRFATLKKHLTAAHALVDTLPTTPEEVVRQHNLLHAIEAQAQPFYARAERSVRIFTTNDSVVRLQRDVRKIVTQNWISADLRAAQLAIVAKIWDVPAVSDFLQSKRSIWLELCDWLNLDVQNDKPLVKNALYAVIFGAGRDKMVQTLGTPALYRRFSQHPLIRALLLARARQLRAIRTMKYGVDAFGTVLDLQYIAVPGKMYAYDTSRKILALIAQSYELMLLSPVIDLAVKANDSSRGFCICTWLHDGFTFKAHDKKYNEYWIERLKEAVAAQAKSLCIITELEIE